jgi:DNA polymerase-3 subunit alpha
VVKRVNLKSVNKRSLEALAKAGAFDTFEDVHRSQYFYKENENSQGFLESLIKFGAKYKEDQASTQTSLFGEAEAVDLEHPSVPECEPWPIPIRLKNEKDVLGFYISGHPLDDFKITIKAACSTDIASLRNDLTQFKDKDVTFAGMVTNSVQKATKRNTLFGIFSLEDFTGSTELRLFSEPYLKMKHLLVPGNNLFIKARVEGSRFDENNLNINIKEIVLLEDALKRVMNKLTLFFKPGEINDQLIKHLQDEVKTSPGSMDLYISILDEQNNRPVLLRAKSSKVDAQLLLNKLEPLGVHFNLSS